MGRIQSFMLILGLVGLGHFTCGQGWVESSKLNLRPALHLFHCTNPLDNCLEIGGGVISKRISPVQGGYFDFREPTAPLLSTAGVTVPQLSFFILYDYTVSQTSCAFLCHNFVKFQQISLSSGTWLKLHAV